MSKTYFCTLKPLDNYFLGGERTFDFGDSQESGKSNYFIHSENEPSQATILGMIRFLVLKKNGLLNKKPSETKELIGEKGFTVDGDDSDYGTIKHLSSVQVYKDGQPIIKTPFNHNAAIKAINDIRTYTPLQMASHGVTDLGDHALLPLDFDAKSGVEHSYLDKDGNIISIDQIFVGDCHTRIAKGQEEDAFFKKEYKYMKPEYCFGFYVEIEEELPDDIVYLGQEKSAFAITFQLVDEEYETVVSKTQQQISDSIKALVKDHAFYYAMSDIYIDNQTAEAIKKCVMYYIADKKSYRFLTNTDGNGTRRKSTQYQFIAAGSVFYVKDEQAFTQLITQNKCTQIGFNQIIKIGE